jgi:DNA (cytosine-5)-methyltransferase 1
VTLQILELFGGIGSPRVALRNLGVPTKSIDYVEIDAKAVDSYNAMFASDLLYKTQSVVNWNLKPDILIHGSPCQDISVAGVKKGADEGSGTRSSLMWETVEIIKNFGVWKPRVVIWENVKGVLHKNMNKNFNKYLDRMEEMGYTNSYQVLNAMDFGLPQKREFQHNGCL